MNQSFMRISKHAPYPTDRNFIRIQQHKLRQYTRAELSQRREVNLNILKNSSIANKLSDKGARLKKVNRIISALLVDPSTVSALDKVTAENTTSFEDCPLTKRLEELSVFSPPDQTVSISAARKRSFDLSNQRAFYNCRPSSNCNSNGLLLASPLRRRNLHSSSKRSSLHQQQYNDSFSTRRQQSGHNSQQVKVKMLTMDESLALQKKNRSSARKCEESVDYQNPSRNLLKSLNLSLNVIQDTRNLEEIEFPQEEDVEEEEDKEYDAMMLD